MIKAYIERIQTIEKKTDPFTGEYSKVKIFYSDGSPFFHGWIQGKIGPLIYLGEHAQKGLAEDEAYPLQKYEEARPEEGGEFGIAPANPKDLDKIKDLRFQNYFDGRFNKISAYKAIDQKIDDRNVCFKACTPDGLIIGQMYMELAEDYIYFNDLYVHKNFRRKGIGRALLKTAEMFTKDIGLSQIQMVVTGDEAAAEKLFSYYRILGYEVEEGSFWEFKPGYCKFDMKKSL